MGNALKQRSQEADGIGMQSHSGLSIRIVGGGSGLKKQRYKTYGTNGSVRELAHIKIIIGLLMFPGKSDGPLVFL